MNTSVRFRILIARFFALQLVIFSVSVSAQTVPSWRRIAGGTIDDGLASPATGPVTAVWYGPAGRSVFARTESGRIFETSDFVHWRLNTTISPPLAANAGTAFSPPFLPEAGAKVESTPGRMYAEGASNLYASEDDGKTWLNLTGFNNRSIIGDGFTGMAVSTANPQEVTAANQFGVWRSLDGGLSWQGLNEDLPNLVVRKLVARRMIALADGTLAEVTAGSWARVPAVDPELALRSRFTGATQTSVTAAAQSGGVAYAGGADGRLLVSHDNGATWNPSSVAMGAAIARVWVDRERPEVALAAAGGHLFRTVNGGVFWDEVTGSLVPGQIHGIAADSSAGIVYLSTDAGVYMASLSLHDASPAAPSWTSIARDLPPAPAWDVLLNADNTLTVALDGYGVFETAAPHRMRTIRLVSGADLTERAAAPGSLVSILGANVATVKSQGVSYPVLASSDESSQLQVPFEAAPGTFSLALEGTNERWTVPLTVKEAAPAIFVDSDGAPLIVDAQSGLVVDQKIPVFAGSTIQILATGLGKVTPEWRSGVPGPVDSPPPVVNGTVTAFLDGQPIEVKRAVLAPAYVGYYLVELQIPSIVNRGANEFRIVMNGEESNRVKLYLEPNTPSQ